jgi:hypothetical protein
MHMHRLWKAVNSLWHLLTLYKAHLQHSIGHEQGKTPSCLKTASYGFVVEYQRFGTSWRLDPRGWSTRNLKILSHVSYEMLVHTKQAKRYHTLGHRLRFHMRVSELHNRVDSNPALLLRGCGFKSLPENRQSEMDFIMVFLSPSRWILR